MCILCVVQKWSRRVATMLPWLVIPLIGLWALSQLLPPGFRFEVTSPRLACVLVLLVTLFWYEILMPQLSAWQARRSAWLRERKRFEAIEMQKLRKMATRRCRNCLTPYRDQKPGGGRFMCSYCGHISKRPVLDMPGPSGITNPGIIGDLVGKGGKIWNGRAWSENGWICGHDWLENGNWAAGSVTAKSSYWGKNGGGFFSGDDHCLAEKSCSGVAVFACNLLASLISCIRWLWRKIFRVGSSREDTLSDAEHKGMLSKKGENGINFHESKWEKARRKAEEKRQARFERELLEEEERKQREEVARLVEERRRLRDEKIEVEKERVKGSYPDEGKDSKREAERKRQERRKEKDKGSSKSSSDCEEPERRSGKESEKKREFDKRSETERRDLQKTVTESVRTQSSEMGHGIKVTTMNNFSRGSGTRYFDRVKGSFISSSKAFNGASFFGKGAQPPATIVSKANKPNGSVDHVQGSPSRREIHSTEHIPGKLNSNGDDKINETSFHRPIASEMQPRATPKKSWQQLFTRSPAVCPVSNEDTISRSTKKPQAEAQSPYLPGQAPPTHLLDDQIHFGLSLPFTPSPFPSPFPNGLINISSISSSAAKPIFPLVGGAPHDFISEDSELFEDPCYVPDPVSLLGPVSESLDNFPLDLGTGFVKDTGLERLRAIKNLSASAEVNKPSPIESPMSRLRLTEERHSNSGPYPFTPKTQDLKTLPLNESNNAHERGTWQMWDTPTFSPLVHGSSDNDPWLQKSLFQPLSGDGENNFPPLIPREDISQKEVTYGSSSRSAIGQPFESSPANCWSKKDWAVHGSGEGVGNSAPARPHIGGLFSTPDKQSLWSFD